MSLRMYSIRTDSREQIIDITWQVKEAVREADIRDGIAVIYCPHTTAAITINENGDPSVKEDLIYGLRRISPNLAEFRHYEGNSDAHLKSSLIGATETVLIEKGELLLGTWQSVYFFECDGPRARTFYVKVIGS